MSVGTSAVVALIYHGRLYVANIGDSRALLCKTDSNEVLRVVQLSVDHDLRNEDELLRLSHLELDIESIRQGSFTKLYLILTLFLNIKIFNNNLHYRVSSGKPRNYSLSWKLSC